MTAEMPLNIFLYNDTSAAPPLIRLTRTENEPHDVSQQGLAGSGKLLLHVTILHVWGFL